MEWESMSALFLPNYFVGIYQMIMNGMAESYIIQIAQ